MGCEQSISVSCGSNGHKRVMTVAVGVADGMAATNGDLNATVTLTMMIVIVIMMMMMLLLVVVVVVVVVVRCLRR